MATLNITVTTRKMPHTAEFFGVTSAVKHFYYALLFSTSPAYARKANRWSTWLGMGFSPAIRSAPPEAGELDRLQTSVRSRGKLIEITASSPNEEMLRKLATVLGEVKSQTSLDGQLLTPVTDSLKSDGVGTEGAASYMAMLKRGVEALTYKDITSIDVKVK